MNNFERIVSDLESAGTDYEIETWLYNTKDQKFITITPTTVDIQNSTTASIITQNALEFRVRCRINQETNKLTVYKEFLALFNDTLQGILKPFKINDGMKFVVDTDGRTNMLGLDFTIITPIEGE